MSYQLLRHRLEFRGFGDEPLQLRLANQGPAQNRGPAKPTKSQQTPDGTLRDTEPIGGPSDRMQQRLAGRRHDTSLLAAESADGPSPAEGPVTIDRAAHRAISRT